MFTEMVDKYIKKHRLLVYPAKIIVGVSGGPDSMALLHYFIGKSRLWQLDLMVVSVDHGLRGAESKQDLEYVRAFCRRYKVNFEAHYIDVNALKEQYSYGTQKAARILRYQVFADVMEKHQADYLALGHHGDDQIETVYMRLTRGTELEAFQGMRKSRPFSNGFLIRPLLSVTKAMIEDYCEENHIVPRRDPSNEADIYTRNFFRIHILPLLKRQNPNLSESILHVTEKIEDDVAYLTNQAETLGASILNYQEQPKKVSCQINELKKHPRALQRRLFHLILNYLYDTLPDGLSYRHEQQFFTLLDSDRANASVDLPSALKMVKSYQTLHFYFEQGTTSYCVPLRVPGQTILPDGHVIQAEFVHIKPTSINPMTFYLPVNGFDDYPSLMIRTRMPGDRIDLVGSKGRKKLKDLFIDKKIPLYKRDHWPILVDEDGRILWVLGLAKGIDLNSGYRDHYLKLIYQFI
ncbi:tRNA lysidine(34) synthetase TilS [Amphibacillus cookii]|uniref:tRNA lysidine(34) synthetase TilS n=1 Tax=Amphibacillus cookii TaxID=767787 RepID=UPI00195BD792|nr:tRNA lysidine(34) synthetase TilS [Amphibacillus cookii]MBM7543186.1 tRNA(Ile)-lysidine synthase [Amphibacillus cookii]